MDKGVFAEKYGKQADRVAFLVAGFLRQLLDDQEMEELDDWILSNDVNLALFEALTEPNRFEKESADWYETGVDHLQAKIETTLCGADTKKLRPAKIIWYTAAAACAATIIFFSLNRIGNSSEWWHQSAQLPTLVFPDGTKKILGEKTGDTIRYKNQLVIYDERPGVLHYGLTGKAMNNGQYHILQVPLGFKYMIRLQDGTTVWINEGSTLRFPETFDSSRRQVELRGEAYFEIAEKKSPFVVVFSNGAIISPGSNIDIRDYKGFETTAVLVSGNAFLSKGRFTAELKDRCMMTIQKNGKIEITDTHFEPYIKWKNDVLRSWDD